MLATASCTMRKATVRVSLGEDVGRGEVERDLDAPRHSSRSHERARWPRRSRAPRAPSGAGRRWPRRRAPHRRSRAAARGAAHLVRRPGRRRRPLERRRAARRACRPSPTSSCTGPSWMSSATRRRSCLLGAAPAPRRGPAARPARAAGPSQQARRWPARPRPGRPARPAARRRPRRRGRRSRARASDEHADGRGRARPPTASGSGQPPAPPRRPPRAAPPRPAARPPRARGRPAVVRRPRDGRLDRPRRTSDGHVGPHQRGGPATTIVRWAVALVEGRATLRATSVRAMSWRTWRSSSRARSCRPAKSWLLRSSRARIWADRPSAVALVRRSARRPPGRRQRQGPDGLAAGPRGHHHAAVQAAMRQLARRSGAVAATASPARPRARPRAPGALAARSASSGPRRRRSGRDRAQRQCPVGRVLDVDGRRGGRRGRRSGAARGRPRGPSRVRRRRLGRGADRSPRRRGRRPRASTPGARATAPTGSAPGGCRSPRPGCGARPRAWPGCASRAS